MDKEFAQKLRASLEALDSRIGQLEHLVNDVIIGGLQTAADEYDDDCKFSEFCDRNKESYEPYLKASTVLFGDEYDLPSELYEAVKKAEGYGTDEFDEAGSVSALLQEIQSKIDGLEELKQEVQEKEEDDIPSEEQLKKEFEEYKN